jgi:hypothetical protein
MVEENEPRNRQLCDLAAQLRTYGTSGTCDQHTQVAKCLHNHTVWLFRRHSAAQGELWSSTAAHPYVSANNTGWPRKYPNLHSGVSARIYHLTGVRTRNVCNKHEIYQMLRKNSDNRDDTTQHRNTTYTQTV